MNNPDITFIKTSINEQPKKVQRGWKIYEGPEVKDSKNTNTLTKFNDIKKDTIITVEDCFGNIRKAKCDTKKKDKTSWAYDTKWNYASYSLVFDKDDRHCWVCNGTNHIDKSVLKDIRGK